METATTTTRTTLGIWTGLSRDAQRALEAIFAGHGPMAGVTELVTKGLATNNETITDRGFEVYLGRKVSYRMES